MFQEIMSIISIWALPAIILLILTMGLIKKVPIYEVFTDGAKDGFKVAINIIPYLVAIIVAISMFRASGILETIQLLFSGFLNKLNIPADVLPLMIVRPLSGSAALGVFSDIANTLGPGCIFWCSWYFKDKICPYCRAFSRLYWNCCSNLCLQMDVSLISTQLCVNSKGSFVITFLTNTA